MTQEKVAITLWMTISNLPDFIKSSLMYLPDVGAVLE